MENLPEVTVLFPVYNEAQSIQQTVNEFYYELDKKIPFKISVVEDGSTDRTKEVLMELQKSISINVMFGVTRRGYALAILEGLKHVNTKYVLIADSDGQYEAKDFWKLYNLREKYDIVSGWRVKREDSTYRRIMSTTFQWLTRRIFKLSIHDVTSSYRLMRCEAAKAVASNYRYMQESFWTEFTVIALKKGLTVAEVPITHKKRQRGSTNVYKLTKIPRIVYSQIIGLIKLWQDIKSHQDQDIKQSI